MSVMNREEENQGTIALWVSIMYAPLIRSIPGMQSGDGERIHLIIFVQCQGGGIDLNQIVMLDPQLEVDILVGCQSFN